MGILCGLGFWQLHRAEFKRTLITQYENRYQSEPQRLITDGPSLAQYAWLQVEGEFDNQHPLLLENKFHHHQFGYHLLLPLKINGTDQHFLINLGWLSGVNGREELPELPKITGPQRLTGFLYYPKQGLTMGDAFEINSTWPKRIQYYGFPEMTKQLAYPLLPYVLLLDSEHAQGLVREWQPVTVPPERHLGYAVQWFLLAAALLTVYFFVCLEKKDLSDEQD